MEKDETIAAQEKRRQQVYADEDDILVRVLDIPEADYECVLVNSSWLERGLLEPLDHLARDARRWLLCVTLILGGTLGIGWVLLR